MTSSGHQWDDFDGWHELLDSLCVEKGYIDNMRLADALCAAAGNRSQQAFDTAVKNLGNWRLGTHLPQRRNFILLSGVLGVETDERLHRVWNTLYAKARSRTNEQTADTVPDVSVFRPPFNRRTKAAAALVVLLAFAAASFSLLMEDPSHPDFQGIDADYVRNVTARVGDALIIHGARGNECGPAPTWEQARELIPELETGTLSDGGIGTRYSRQCGGRTPARAILYKAERPGDEMITLYGDPIHIKVQ
ncbi:hypothetical protein [Mesorhizobium sp. CAU 1741]|uniref:hypothetical protein n=1 Tax=Mesorhizobium sp. CAU 1741 TaxID=3140366 RepID=UPI00325BB5B7